MTMLDPTPVTTLAGEPEPDSPKWEAEYGDLTGKDDPSDDLSGEDGTDADVGALSPEAFAALTMDELLALREKDPDAWEAAKRGLPATIGDISGAAPIDADPPPVRDMTVAGHQASHLAKQLDAAGVELSDEAQAQVDRDYEAGRPDRPDGGDPVAMARVLRTLRQAKDELDAAAPFGRIISRRQAISSVDANGEVDGITITEVDVSGRTRSRVLGPDELEPRDFSRRATADDGLPEDPFTVTVADYAEWPIDKRVRFNKEHPEVAEAFKRGEGRNE